MMIASLLLLASTSSATGVNAFRGVNLDGMKWWGVRDTFISQAAPTVNYGRDWLLEGGPEKTIFLSFEGLAGLVPANMEIAEAELVLTKEFGDAEGAKVRSLAQPWIEGGGRRGLATLGYERPGAASPRAWSHMANPCPRREWIMARRGRVRWERCPNGRGQGFGRSMGSVELGAMGARGGGESILEYSFSSVPQSRRIHEQRCTRRSPSLATYVPTHITHRLRGGRPWVHKIPHGTPSPSQEPRRGEKWRSASSDEHGMAGSRNEVTGPHRTRPNRVCFGDSPHRERTHSRKHAGNRDRSRGLSNEK